MWRKVRSAIDESTLEVRAVEVTDSTVDDVPMLPDLLSQIPAGEPIALGEARRTPMTPMTDAPAVTLSPCEARTRSFRPAATPSPGRRTAPAPGGRNDDLRAMNRVGRTLWRKWSCYHRRSRVDP